MISLLFFVQNYSKKIDVHGKSVDLHLVDTAGQEEYDRIRAISYADCDAVLICFSTTNSNTLDAVQSKVKKKEEKTRILMIVYILFFVVFLN